MTSSCWPGQQWWRVHYSTDLDFQHRSSHWCHIQQDDHSAASPSLLIAVLYALPDILSYASSFHTDCAGDSLQPISIGKSQTLHTLSLQTAIRSAYLRLFLSCASSQFSSHEKFSSISSIIFDCWDTSTKSGLILVSTKLEKSNFLSKSTLNFQSCPLSSTDFSLGTLISAVASLFLTNSVCPCFMSIGIFLLSAFSTSANTCRTLSCHHLHLSQVSAPG